LHCSIASGFVQRNNLGKTNLENAPRQLGGLPNRAGWLGLSVERIVINEVVLVQMPLMT